MRRSKYEKPAPREGGSLKTSAMIASFADPGQKTAAAPFGHALARLAEQDPRVVGLSADLAKYTDMHIFRQAHPERFFQVGMAEQLLFGAAAGMAEVGLIPFASTYSVFAARRAYDFICLDIAEPGLNVNVVGALPGLTTGYGPSHQATEDLAILRGCPGLTIVDPCDAVDIEQAVPALACQPDTTRYVALRDTPALGTLLRRGDLLRVEACSIGQLQAAKAMLTAQLPDQKRTFTLYHLDSTLLRAYPHVQLRTLLPIP